MADSALETVSPPFMTFRFEVVLDLNEPLPGVPSPVCSAAFAECDGLELSMEPKSLREGGNNTQQIHLRGPVRMGQLTLRRGMTANHGLWLWMQAAVVPGKDRMASGQVTLRGTDGEPALTFKLIDCMPIKMRGPSLNAKDGQWPIPDPGERHEDEGAFGDARVRDDEAGGVHREITEKEDIDVDDARAPAIGWRAPNTFFAALCGQEQCFGTESGRAHEHGIEVTGLAFRKWRRLPNSGDTVDRNACTGEAVDGGLEVGEAVAEVRTEREDDFNHGCRRAGTASWRAPLHPSP